MATYRLWPATLGPASSVTDNQPLNLGTEVRVSTPAWATALHFWRGLEDITSPVTGRIWRADTVTTGTVLPGSEVVFTLTGTGWQTAALAVPVALDPAFPYKVSISVSGRWSVTHDYFTTGPGAAGITNGVLTAPAPAQSVNGQGVFSAGTSAAYPGNSGGGRNYWVDLSVIDIAPTTRVPLGQAAVSHTVAPLRIAKKVRLGQLGEHHQVHPLYIGPRRATDFTIGWSPLYSDWRFEVQD